MAPGGSPGIELMLPILLTQVHMLTSARLTAENVARLYGLFPKKGAIAPGAAELPMAARKRCRYRDGATTSDHGR